MGPLLTLYHAGDIETFYQSVKASIMSITDIGFGLMAFVVGLLLIRPLVSYFLGLASGGDDDSGGGSSSFYNEHRRMK